MKPKVTHYCGADHLSIFQLFSIAWELDCTWRTHLTSEKKSYLVRALMLNIYGHLRYFMCFICKAQAVITFDFLNLLTAQGAGFSDLCFQSPVFPFSAKLYLWFQFILPWKELSTALFSKCLICRKGPRKWKYGWPCFLFCFFSSTTMSSFFDWHQFSFCWVYVVLWISFKQIFFFKFD